MGKVITVSNEAGGIGKSSIIFHSAKYLASKKKKILIIDTDAQGGNITFFTGVQFDRKQDMIQDLIDGECSIEDAIMHVSKNIDIIGANGKTKSLMSSTRFTELRTVLNTVRDQYDYIFIDVNPNPDNRHMLALVTSDYLLIPANQDKKGLKACLEMYDSYRQAKELNPDLKILGIVFTMVEDAALGRAIQETMEEVVEQMDTKIFTTKLRRYKAYSNCIAYNAGVTEKAPTSLAAEDVISFCKEFEKEVKKNG